MGNLTSVESLEPYLISAFIKDRETYEAFKRFGTPDGFGQLGRYIFSLVDEYYGADPDVRHVPRGYLEQRISRLPNPKHGEAFTRFVNGLPGDVSSRNLTRDIVEHRKHYIGGKLSLALANKTKEIPDLLKSYAEADDYQGEGDSQIPEGIVNCFETIDLDSTEPEEARIKLWPTKTLNERLDGGARRGHHVLVFGRPEVGKTLVTVNLVAGFVKQRLRVLYIANEEPAEDIRERIRKRILKVPRTEMKTPEARARLAAIAEFAGVDIAPLAPGSFPEITRLVQAKAYDVLVLDQLRNLRVSKDSTRTEALEAAAIEARNVAKKHRVLVISVTQAGDSASGKSVLDMSDVDNSKTGIPGAVDLMIGVGATKDMQTNGLISLSLCKNKLGGNHDSFTVSYDRTTGTIE